MSSETDSKPDEEAQIWDQFAVELPTGTPVLTYFLGENRALHILKQTKAMPEREVCQELFGKMNAVAQLFGRPVTGEVLWYVEGENVTFAAFSHFLSGAGRMDSFAPTAKTFFKEYFI